MSALLPDGLPFDQQGNPRERYVRVGYDGSWCILKPADVDDFIAESDLTREDCRIVDVFLSQAEYEALPEFEGY